MAEDKLGESTEAKFIAKYVKPYDAASDDYDMPPFDRSFDHASKSSKIYNMHMYWVKQDPYIVKQFIEHYTRPGDVVLDAFCGAGMTGVAALMCGRNAILSDISPICIHIARNYTTPVDLHAVDKAYRELLSKAGPEMQRLYRTRCHKCGNREAQIANTILSDVYSCPRCNAENLYAGRGRWEQMKRGEKVDRIVCNQCNYQFTKNDAAFARIEPIELRIHCPRCKVKGEERARPLNQNDWRDYITVEGGPTRVVHQGNDEWNGYEFRPVQAFTDDIGTRTLKRILEDTGKEAILPQDVPYWYPKDTRFQRGFNTRQPLRRGITHPFQMFSRRNLSVLSVIWRYVNENDDEHIRDKLRLVFTSLLFNCSYQYRWRTKGGGGSRGTLYIPSLIQDNNVCDNLVAKYRDLVDAIGEMAFKKDCRAFVEIADARSKKTVANDSIDYAFYDPPYGSNINYSELNIMWEAWLGQYTDTKLEIIENKEQGKTRLDYERMMTEALKEAYRLLKPGRWLSLIYSYSDPSMYRSVQNMAGMAGFVQEGEVLHIGSASKTKKQLDSDKSQQRYLIIDYRKPKATATHRGVDKTDIEYRVITIIQEHLFHHGGQNRDRIYDEVIKRLFTSVQIEKFDLDQILNNFFRKVGDTWYAPGTLLTYQTRPGKKGQLRLAMESGDPEVETVIRLQDFLKKHGTVPLAELREYYLRTIPPEWQGRVSFEKAIEGFTVKEAKVRLPTEEEQRIKQDVAVRYQRMQISRYLAGETNYSPDSPELCRWIEFCYEHELSPEVVDLFQRLPRGSTDEASWKRAKRIADACSLKLA